jgi:hypothetical protein
MRQRGKVFLTPCGDRRAELELRFVAQIGARSLAVAIAGEGDFHHPLHHATSALKAHPTPPS